MSPDPNNRIERPSRDSAPAEPSGAAHLLKSNLVGLGSAAVIAVYAAGFERTRAAAARFSEADAGRRFAAPIRTTGEIGALKPRATDSMPAPAPIVAPKPVNHLVAEPAPATRRSTRTPEAVTTRRTAAVDTVVSPTPMPPPPPTPTQHDSAPAPAKPIDAPVTPKSAPPTADTAQSDKEVVRKDGTYTGWGTSRHGDIQATVQIKDGKIVFAAISECLTQYSCSWIAALPPQVLSRQSADVDIVSGATQSTNAFYYAVLEALNKAK